MHTPADESQTEMTESSVPARKSRHKSRGQSIVEFALVVPILLTFLLIAADFGRALTAYMSVSSAAREGAAYASRSSDSADDTNAIRQAALNEVGSEQQIWGVSPTVTVQNGAGLVDDQNYRKVVVTVNYTFTPLFSVWPIPETVPMERSVSMRVLGN